MNTQEIANTILQQLGGNKFKVMTGAHNFLYGTDKSGNPFLQFKIKGCRRVSWCKITLTPQDLYDMEFSKLYNLDVKTVDKKEGLYCDMLQDIFTSVTGLDTHL